MQAALEQVKGQLGHTYPAGNQWPRSGHRRNGRFARPVALPPGRRPLGQGDRRPCAARPLTRPRRRFPVWRDTEPAERADYLLRIAAKSCGGAAIELAAWQVYECGKPWREADADVAEAIDFCELLRPRDAPIWRAPRHRDVAGEENVYFYEPRGVAVVIAPWNFPLAILTGMTTAALVTGNTVIMKPAEQSAVIGAKLMEVFREVGLPPGVVSYPAGHRRGDRAGAGQSPRRGPDRLHWLAQRRPAHQPPGRRDAAGTGPRQARDRRDGRQERDHRRRRRRPGRGGARRRRQRLRLRRARSARRARGSSCWRRSTTRSCRGWSRRRAA